MLPFWNRGFSRCYSATHHQLKLRFQERRWTILNSYRLSSVVPLLHRKRAPVAVAEHVRVAAQLGASGQGQVDAGRRGARVVLVDVGAGAHVGSEEHGA